MMDSRGLYLKCQECDSKYPLSAMFAGCPNDAGALEVKTCVLLRKDRPSAKEMNVDYVGFEIPDEFVVGYGLDYNNYYRNLPDIVTLTAEAVERMRTAC